MSESTIGIPDAVATESLSYAETDMTLREIATDLQEAHRELDEYYSGSLVLAQNLKELRHCAEAEGNTELVETTRKLEQSAMAVVERSRE
ncbi:hypothetical protein [Haloarcula laminariae]|uniref:hypothetical protein n=1 Tax=Haloarcula laminariae TaxID=2961577 RepID=UPI0021CAB942|nr:hypothetical protein [Halomicroarcula laminariae]